MQRLRMRRLLMERQRRLWGPWRRSCAGGVTRSLSRIALLVMKTLTNDRRSGESRGGVQYECLA